MSAEAGAPPAAATATAATPTTPPPDAWRPHPEGVAQVLKLLTDAVEATSSSAHHDVLTQLEIMKKHPEFNNYLAFVFAHLKDQSEAVRAHAGLNLKNNIKDAFELFHPASRDYVKQQVWITIGDESQYIRNTVGTIITTIASKERLRGWPGLLENLVGLLESDKFPLVDGALGALAKICEDLPSLLDSEELGRPLNVILPKLITLFLSPTEAIRKYSLGAVNIFLYMMPSALVVNLDKYMKSLFALTGDPSKEIRKRVCQALVVLLEVRFDYLAPHLDNVIKYMLHATTDEDEVVALEACEFWSAYCETKNADLVLLKSYLPQLVPVLLKGMVYTEIDLLILGGDDEDETVPDRESDIAPRSKSSTTVRGTGTGGAAAAGAGAGAGAGAAAAAAGTEGAAEAEPEEDEEDEEWDEEELSDWNLRKCSAASLDTLANVYRAELMPHLFIPLQNLLSSKTWEVRESGILALGAIAEGCYDGIKDSLRDILPYLVTAQLQDPKALVRSITCWTLSRYAKWVMADTDDAAFFRPLMIALLERVLDRNKKVQEAACSAFATLEEEAGERLLPYLGGILTNLMLAFSKYQAKNMLILYDAIGTLAEAVGGELNRPEYIDILMPPLMARWNKLADDDRNIFPLLECLTSVAQALKMGFARFAQPVFERCCSIIEKTLIAHQHAVMAKASGMETSMPDKEFVVCALDLLSGLTEGLGASIEGLVGKSNMLVLLFECLKDEDPDVRQSAFALLGDLAKTCIGHLAGHLDKFLPMAARNLNPKFVSVCNNASWAIGEIAVKIGPEMKVHVTHLMQYLMPIINTDTLITSLLENTAITIGRLGLVCPGVVAPLLEQFARNWCIYLARIKENHEKEHAFKGLCAVIAQNPRAMLPQFPVFCNALTSWSRPNEEMLTTFHTILTSFKSSLGDKWMEVYSKCPAKTQHTLSSIYKI